MCCNRSILPILFLLAHLAYSGCTSQAPDPPPTPPDLTPYLEQARALYQADRFDAAATVCQNGLALDSSSVALLNLLASSYSAQGRYSLAVEALEKILTFQPDYTLAHINLGGIYTKLGQYAKAEPHLLSALALDPHQSAVRRRVGELYLGTGRPAQAAEQFQQALLIFPEDATLYFYLGQALEANDRTQDALHAFEKATTLDIGFGEAYYRLGVLARKTQRPQLAALAVSRFGHLQQIGATDPDAVQQMKALRASILNAPEDAVHHYNLGLFFLRHQYTDEALNKFAKTARLQPDAIQRLHQIGDRLLQSQLPADALTYYQAALAHDPTYLPALINAGNISGRLQQVDAALAYYRQATQAHPQDPVGWYHLGLGLFNTGRPTEAQAPLRRGLALSPPGSEWETKIRRLLALLEQKPRVGEEE